MSSAPRISAPIIAAVSDVVASAETHATLDSLFMHAGASGDPPSGSKHAKAQAWLRATNNQIEPPPLEVLGRIIEQYMEADLDDRDRGDVSREWKEKIEKALGRAELQYVTGGSITGSVGLPSRTLEDLIRGRDVRAIDEEFQRAVRNVESSPREAISAASNILESICKTYIEEEGLEMPKRQDLQPVWGIVSKDLNFDPARVEDRDLKEILGGLRGVVSGIGALRTHASSAHGAGAKTYRIEARHARLAVHAAHTMATFILESWTVKGAV